MTTLGELRQRWAGKCPSCGDLDGKHIAGCRFAPPFGTFTDMCAYYENQHLAIVGHTESTTEVVQRVRGEPYRPDPHPDYVVVVQVVSLHHRKGLKPELIEETELAEVSRYPKLTQALRHAETLSPMIRLIGACDRCSGSGELMGDQAAITCPDCEGEGRQP